MPVIRAGAGLTSQSFDEVGDQLGKLARGDGRALAGWIRSRDWLGKDLPQGFLLGLGAFR